MNFEKLPKLTFWRAVLVLILAPASIPRPASFHKGSGSCDESDGPFPVGLVDWI